MLTHKDTIFQQPYNKIIYISPNLNTSQHLGHETKLCNDIQSAAAPVPVLFQSQLPKVDELLDSIENEKTRILILIDDYNEEAFSNPNISTIFTRLSTHFGLVFFNCADLVL